MHLPRRVPCQHPQQMFSASSGTCRVEDSPESAQVHAVHPLWLQQHEVCGVLQGQDLAVDVGSQPVRTQEVFKACDEDNKGYLSREVFKVAVVMLFVYKPSKPCGWQGLGALAGYQAWASEVGEPSSGYWTTRDLLTPCNINQRELSQRSPSQC